MSAGVIFDLDGVIIDSEGLQYKAYSEVLARWGVAVSREEYAEHWIARGRGPKHAVTTYQLPLSPDELRDLKNPVYHEILRAEVTLMPAARDALERLHGSFQTALATNSNRLDVDYVLDHFDLRRFFTAVVPRDDYVHAKPAPDAFTTAVRALALAPSLCVVLEDAHKGVVAARAACTAVIAIPNVWTATNDFSAADRIVESLDDVTAALVNELVG